MQIRSHIAVILLVVLSSAATSSGVNYIRDEPIVRPNGTRVASENDTTPQIRELGDVERQRQSSRPRIADTVEEKKTLAEKRTLALLLLLLRDGRGAR
jgi:hypothetical protein